jgi:hypothetical protein
MIRLSAACAPMLNFIVQRRVSGHSKAIDHGDAGGAEGPHGFQLFHGTSLLQRLASSFSGKKNQQTWPLAAWPRTGSRLQ